MRTTLDIDDDVLQAAKERARTAGISAGKALSALAREALTSGAHDGETGEFDEILGFAPLPRRDVIVTNEMVLGLIDEEGVV